MAIEAQLRFWSETWDVRRNWHQQNSLISLRRSGVKHAHVITHMSNLLKACATGFYFLFIPYITWVIHSVWNRTLILEVSFWVSVTGVTFKSKHRKYILISRHIWQPRLDTTNLSRWISGFLTDVNTLSGTWVLIAWDPKKSVIVLFFINLTAVECQQHEVYQTLWRGGLKDIESSRSQDTRL